MATNVSPQAKPAQAGEVIEVRDATTPIPDRCLAEDVIIAIRGQQSELLRIKEIAGQTPNRIFHLSNLIRRQTKALTEAELNVMRPLAFVIPDRPWRRLGTFVDGGLYQVWPTGRLLRVRQGVLVDAVTNQRVYGDTDRQKLVRLLPFLIPRWVPARGATTAQEE